MGKAIDELPDKPSDENQCKLDQATLRDACLHLLGCNFDTVQIIATRHDAGRWRETRAGRVDDHLGRGKLLRARRLDSSVARGSDVSQGHSNSRGKDAANNEVKDDQHRRQRPDA
jgi:hypothetical protein